MPTVLRSLGIEHLDSITECLVESFKKDGFYEYHVQCDNNTPAQQDAVGYAMFKYTVSALLLSGGQVHAIIDTDSTDPFQKLLAVAVWLPPAVKVDSGLIMTLRSGMWRLNYLFGPETKHRFFNEFVASSSAEKKRILNGRDIWYLMYLGTRPEARGKGHSRTLIQFVTAQADATKTALYLESSTRENASTVYAKHGFVELGELIIGPSDKQINIPCMLREPK